MTHNLVWVWLACVPILSASVAVYVLPALGVFRWWRVSVALLRSRDLRMDGSGTLLHQDSAPAWQRRCLLVQSTYDPPPCWVRWCSRSTSETKLFLASCMHEYELLALRARQPVDKSWSCFPGGARKARPQSGELPLAYTLRRPSIIGALTTALQQRVLLIYHPRDAGA